jgi:transcriptional regulator with XRE-family HTH domain
MVRSAQRQTVFTRRLKEVRKRAALTQAQLGVLAGIDEFSASARVNQYERGVHFPDYGTAQRLASALKVPVSYLFEEDEVLAALILIYGELKSPQKKQLVRLAEEIHRADK